MAITVKFFAQLREQLGKNSLLIPFESPITIEKLWETISPDLSMPNNTLCAINLEYVNKETEIKDGDEVAFFPPVTGG
jgi:molybdopterin synthase sulfur carrier subunit